MPHEITVTTDGLFRIVCDDRGYGLFVGGKPLWEMVGGASDTCGGWFSLVDEPLRPRTPDEINERLGRGVDAVDGALVESIVPLLPRGRYTVGLLRAAPIRQCDADNWYRCRCVEREIRHRLPPDPDDAVDPAAVRTFLERYQESEDILPHLPIESIDWKRVGWYREALSAGSRPTAMVVSLGEMRHPGGGSHTVVRLSHFVIDGHHKLVAAAQTGTPLTLLSFFAHDHSLVPIDRFRTRHPDEFATTILPDDRIERLWVEQQIRLLDGADGA
ncbi:MAG: hypothetical protein ACKO3G_18165 [Planctomycetaceae bacterium]